MIEGVVRAAGGTISTTLRAAASAAFGVANVLIPLLTAKAITTMDWVTFGLGMAQVTAGLIAAGAASIEAEKIEQGANVGMGMLGGINAIVGGLNIE